jgi:hypothetical protein
MGIRTFYAQLKGLAKACEYKINSLCQCARNNTIDYADHVIQDQLVLGIADHEILGDEKTDRSTTKIVEYIARKKQAKAERGTVCGEAPVAAAVTPKRGAYAYS